MHKCGCIRWICAFIFLICAVSRIFAIKLSAEATLLEILFNLLLATGFLYLSGREVYYYFRNKGRR